MWGNRWFFFSVFEHTVIAKSDCPLFQCSSPNLLLQFYLLENPQRTIFHSLDNVFYLSSLRQQSFCGSSVLQHSIISKPFAIWRSLATSPPGRRTATLRRPAARLDRRIQYSTTASEDQSVSCVLQRQVPIKSSQPGVCDYLKGVLGSFRCGRR